MEGTADGVASVAEPAAARAGELAQALGITVEAARRLIDAGHDSPEAARALSADELEQLGLGAIDRETILRPAATAGATPTSGPSVNTGQIVERWVGSVSRTERTRRPKLAPSGKASTDVLRRWVDGDDRAME